ncbi:hypothetical protein [Pantoea septica]|uniref:hypothetical protein n=1 Tax=Pantoea septica TaxID=472695 RepID=UPI001301AA17|nr:hypothetical protein [Pantoea septica]
MSDKDELERQRFESWIVIQPGGLSTDMYEPTQRYFEHDVQLAWKAWLARSKQDEA